MDLTDKQAAEKERNEELVALVEAAAKSGNIHELQRAANTIARAKGFWDGAYIDDSILIDQKLLLIVGEISEAHEEIRSGKPLLYDHDGKPEGLVVELADAVIRIMDTVHELGFDLGEVVAMKMKYNATRPYKHGRRF